MATPVSWVSRVGWRRYDERSDLALRWDTREQKHVQHITVNMMVASVDGIAGYVN